MNGRERIRAAFDGGIPDRIPLALSFYEIDGRALAPPDAWRDDLVDVAFVAFPISPEETELRRLAMPFDGNTRIGSVSQAARYANWGYHPEEAPGGNPLEAARSLDDLERFPFPSVDGPYVADGLAAQVASIHARGLAAGGNTPHLGGELFEAAWRLRGLESFLLDLVERKEMAHYLLDQLADLARRNAVALAASGVDVLTSITAVIACMFNIGPGLGLVGPAEHYGHLPALAKWTLAVAMIAGRLEFYTLVVILTPTFWRR